MSTISDIQFLPKREFPGVWFFLNLLTPLKTPEKKNAGLKSVKAESILKIT